MRYSWMILAVFWSSSAWAGDGADSPAQIDKFTKQLAKIKKCTLQSGEIKFAPAPCKATPSQEKAANGATLWQFSYNGKAQKLSGTLAPDNGKVTFAGTSTCSGAKPTAYNGVLQREGPMLWFGTLTPQPKSALCGPFELSLGK